MYSSILLSIEEVSFISGNSNLVSFLKVSTCSLPLCFVQFLMLLSRSLFSVRVLHVFEMHEIVESNALIGLSFCLILRLLVLQLLFLFAICLASAHRTESMTQSSGYKMKQKKLDPLVILFVLSRSPFF